MTSSLIRANVVRFIIFVLLQGFVLKGINLDHIDLYLYPLFILMLPVGILDGVLLFVCFLIGMAVDIFYGTLGLFASAAVFTGAARQVLLGILEPRGGYDKGIAITKKNLGTTWFVQYSAILLTLHSFWVAIFEDLQFSWFYLFRVIFIAFLSFLIAILYQFIFNPSE